MRILEENDQTSLYVIIGLALMLIVFIMIGIFLEKAEVRILSLKVFIDQTLAWKCRHPRGGYRIQSHLQELVQTADDRVHRTRSYLYVSDASDHLRGRVQPQEALFLQKYWFYFTLRVHWNSFLVPFNLRDILHRQSGHYEHHGDFSWWLWLGNYQHSEDLCDPCGLRQHCPVDLNRRGPIPSSV